MVIYRRVLLASSDQRRNNCVNARVPWANALLGLGQRTFGVRMRGVITSQVIQNLGIPAETQESRNKKVCVPRRLSVGHRREKLFDW